MIYKGIFCNSKLHFRNIKDHDKLQAIRELERKSIVNFKIRDIEEDYIDVYRGSGCSSKIGRVGGRQEPFN